MFTSGLLGIACGIFCWRVFPLVSMFGRVPVDVGSVVKSARAPLVLMGSFLYKNPSGVFWVPSPEPLGGNGALSLIRRKVESPAVVEASAGAWIEITKLIRLVFVIFRCLYFSICLAHCGLPYAAPRVYSTPSSILLWARSSSLRLIGGGFYCPLVNMTRDRWRRPPPLSCICEIRSAPMMSGARGQKIVKRYCLSHRCPLMYISTLTMLR